MSLSLYTIQEEYRQMADFLLSTGGEITEGVEQALNINKEQLQNKAVNYGFVVKQMEAEIEMIEGELQRLEDNKKRREKAVQRLKDTLSTAMQLYGIEKIEQPGILKISFRKSEATIIDDEKMINPKFIKTKETKSIDKVAINKAIEAGEDVQGAWIQTNYNIQIK